MSDFLSTILSFLWSRSGYILAIILGILIYELLKAAVRKPARRMARYLAENKPKVGAGVALVLITILSIWFLMVVV